MSIPVDSVRNIARLSLVSRCAEQCLACRRLVGEGPLGSRYQRQCNALPSHQRVLLPSSLDISSAAQLKKDQHLADGQATANTRRVHRLVGLVLTRCCCALSNSCKARRRKPWKRLSWPRQTANGEQAESREWRRPSATFAASASRAEKGTKKRRRLA